MCFAIIPDRYPCQLDWVDATWLMVETGPLKRWSRFYIALGLKVTPPALNLCRDYFAEVQLCVESALPNWDVKHLSLWKELVDPVVDPAESVEDVSMLEETTAAAQFC